MMMAATLLASTMSLLMAEHEPERTGKASVVENMKEKRTPRNMGNKRTPVEQKVIQETMAKMAGVEITDVPDVQVQENQVAELRTRAEQGDTAALVRLGHYAMNQLEEGKGSEEEALGYFAQAAQAGDAEAAMWHALATYQLHARAGASMWKEKSVLRAALEEPAAKGNLPAQYLLALTTGGIPREEQMQQMRAVAEAGFVPAMRQLGELITEYNFHEMRLTNSYNREAKYWLELAGEHGDYYAYSLLSQEGDNYVGNPSQRPAIDYEKNLAALEKNLELIRALKPRWFGNTFHLRLLDSGAFVWGGERAYAYLMWCGREAVVRTMRLKQDAKTVHEDIVKRLQSLAAEGDQDAMVALVYLYLKWEFWMGPDSAPPPYDEAPYMQELRRQVEAGDNRLRLKLRDEPKFRNQYEKEHPKN